MGKIYYDIETEYDRGDLVIFKKDRVLLVGIVEGYYVDNEAGNSIWYNIRVNEDLVYTFFNGGDIAEWDILAKIDDNYDIRAFIVGKIEE